MPTANIVKTIATRFRRGNSTDERRKSILELIGTKRSEISMVPFPTELLGLGSNLTRSGSLAHQCSVLSAVADAVIFTDSTGVVAVVHSEHP